MIDNAGKYYVINGKLQPADDSMGYETSSGRTAYEVIRIINGKALFLEDHIERMKETLKAADLKYDINPDLVKSEIAQIAAVHDTVNFNVKLVIYPCGNEISRLLYVSKSYYPSKYEVENGVHVKTAFIERINPNAKIENTAYKQKVKEIISENNIFEVLLVNSDGFITEGSKSNVFFAEGGKIITPPEKYVLKGITRKYVIEACRRQGIEVVEKLIDLKHLYEVEGLFISGTSIKVLPISKVDEAFFNSPVNETIVKVRDEYDRIIDEYLTNS